MIYVTGDKHGNFEKLKDYLLFAKVSKKDIVIIVGDVGLNYFNDTRDDDRKKMLIEEFKCTFLCIHGNHEMRPWHNKMNIRTEWHDGYVYRDDRYPNILYAEDGSIFNLNGKKFAVLGGAYSVDKEYRLQYGYRWFEDEQPSEEIKRYVESQLESVDYKIDYVLSHTSPLKYEPKEAFLKGMDQKKVDKSTEKWLDSIENKLQYEHWYCGHYHINKRIDQIDFLYEDVILIS